MELIRAIIAFFVGITIMFVGVAGVILVMALLWAIPTILLWNWLMPDLFGLPVINIWQAIGINLLAGILFKSSKSEKTEKKTKKSTKKEILLG